MLASAEAAKAVSALQYLVRKPELLTDEALRTAADRCLDHHDVAVRFWARKLRSAVEQLAAKRIESSEGALTARSVSELLEMLKRAPSGYGAIEILRELVTRSGDELRGTLLTYLAQTTDTVQISFLTKHLGLRFPDDDMLSRLLPYLKHGDDRVVANTVEGVEPMESSAAVAVLAQLLSHPSQRVRANAAKALNRHAPEKATGVLRQMLQMHDQPNFVLAACHAVRHLRHREFLPTLAGLLTDPVIASEAMKTISVICGDVAIQLLDQLPEVAKDVIVRQRLLMAVEEHLAASCPVDQNPWAPLQASDNRRVIEVGEKRLFALQPSLTLDEAQKKALANKRDAFGVISKFLYRPREDQIRLTYREMRYEPFWHVVCQLCLDYTRAREVDLNIERPVQSVRVGRQILTPEQGRIRLTMDEHCVEECLKEVFIDAQTGAPGPYQRHLAYPRREIRETEELMVDEVIVVPARIKASPVVRDLLTEILKPVRATEINHEQISLHRVNLLFRPVYAFEFQWEDSQSFAVLEIDGLTGEVVSGKALKKKFDELFSESSLFELGSEAIDLVIPGGGLAAKLARAVLGKN
ncbi:MAG TPA: HEAT repeat domain-containing protein [Candidatus Ozemobacteraceae bacterium]|nr:HEAT repeat domain-containing protein [Candidatus Ozemobacteraceae bacterium]